MRNCVCAFRCELMKSSVSPHSIIASQRVRAKRGPMTGSAKQSRIPPRNDWIASSHQRKIASQFCRELLAMTAWRKRALELRSRAPDAAQRFPGDAKHRPVRRCAAEPGPMHQPVARLPGSRLCAPLRYACPGHERWASMIASLERTRDRQRLTHGVPKDQWNVIELPLPKAPKWCFSAFHDPIAPKRAVRAALQACP